MRDDLKEAGEIVFIQPPFEIKGASLKLSFGVTLANNPSFRQNSVYDEVKVIEDIEPPERLNQALEHLFRLVKQDGKFIISKELWEKARFQPNLRGLYFSNKYQLDGDLIIFFT